MKKKVVIALIVLVIAGLAGFSLYKSQNKLLNPLGNKGNALIVVPSEPVSSWKDPMGFTFDYPKNLSLNPHDEDKDNYAHVEITATGSAGSIVVWAKDSSYATLDDWVKKDKTVSSGNSIDTSWGDQKAKKVIITGDNPRVVTAVLYDDMLWLAEEFPDKGDRWDKAYNNVVSSFKFYPLGGARASAGNSNGPPSVDNSSDSGGDEEVVQ